MAMNNQKFENIEVSADDPDWGRERKSFFAWDPARSLLACIRSYQCYSVSRNPLSRLICKTIVLRHRFWSVVTGADIPLNSQIGGGLLLPHPNGIVIHPEAVIGPNCLIFQQVTIGTRSGSRPPVVGGHVDIGAGAKVLGAIIIGDHANVGANAVVLKDIPSGKSAIGIPAKILGEHEVVTSI